MPVDSMHAVIEKYIKLMEVQTILRNSRKRPKPYEVMTVDHTMFLDWKQICQVKPIRDISNKIIKTNDIRLIKFYKENESSKVTMKKTYEENEQWTEVQLKVRHGLDPKRLYQAEQPINKRKLENLHNPCKTFAIKPQYHHEYYALKANNTVPDQLDETDIEDVIDEKVH